MYVVYIKFLNVNVYFNKSSTEIIVVIIIIIYREV